MRLAAQGFVINSFEHVLRMHPDFMSPNDVGNTSGVACAALKSAKVSDAKIGASPKLLLPACVEVARNLRCTQYTFGLSASQASHFVDAQPLLKVFKPKLGVFGGPPM